jgi:hypothetical protein
MVISKSTASPSPTAYRVDTVRGEQGNTFQVMRCEPAAFLVDLLTKGGAHGQD